MAEVFNTARMNRLVAESIPIVEYLAGRRFLSQPRVIFCSVPDLIPPLRTELAIMDRAFPSVAREQTNPIEYRARVHAAALLGKYFFSEGTLRVVPAQVADHLDAHRIPLEEALEAVRLVLIHELAHALHDQHAGLGKQFLALRSDDEYLALAAVSEGFATWIQRRARAWLELPGALDRMTELIADQRDEQPAADPILLRRFEASAVESAATYNTGADYMAELYTSGGHGSVWQALTGELPEPDAVWRTARKRKEVVGPLEATFRRTRTWDSLEMIARGQGLSPVDIGGALLRFDASLTGLKGEGRRELLGSLRHALTFSALDTSGASERAFEVRLVITDPAKTRRVAELLGQDFHAALAPKRRGENPWYARIRGESYPVPGIAEAWRETVVRTKADVAPLSCERRVFVNDGWVAEWVAIGWKPEEGVWNSLAQNLARDAAALRP